MNDILARDNVRSMINDLLGEGKGGSVRLVDCMPRMVPDDRGCDFAIVRNARVSTGNGLKSPDADQSLIKRLYNDNHTSPFESVSFVFEITCPLFVAIHFIRHRTAKINMFSQRYASVDKLDLDTKWYSPAPRMQHTRNHQGSADDCIDVEHQVLLQDMIDKANKHLMAISEIYTKMIENGMAREVARYCLPESCFTKMYFEMDLNNLIKFFRLRCAEDTQWETRVFAIAMKELVKPLLPMVAPLM